MPAFAALGEHPKHKFHHANTIGGATRAAQGLHVVANGALPERHGFGRQVPAETPGRSRFGVVQHELRDVAPVAWGSLLLRAKN